MPLITLIVYLIVIGALLYLVSLAPIDATIKKIINGIVIIVVILWRLTMFGLLAPLQTIRIGR
jgi:hypothetical protein